MIANHKQTQNSLIPWQPLLYYISLKPQKSKSDKLISIIQKFIQLQIGLIF